MRPELGPWPLALVALGVGARLLAGPALRLRLSPFDAPVALFTLAALIAANLSYAPAAAWDKFWVLAGGVALYGAAIRAPMQARASLVRPLLAALPLVIAVYFVLTNDWLQWQYKFPAVASVTSWIASWQPALPGHRLHPNVAGGLLAVLIPLQLAAVLSSGLFRRRSLRVAAALLLAAPAAVVLLLTGSRGAWLGLLVGAGIWFLSRLPRLIAPSRRAVTVAVTLLMFSALALLAQTALAAPELPGTPSLPTDLAGRLGLLRNSLDLALDTPFTGLGLATYMPAYSAYVMILHVGYQIHSHNLVVNVWLELGVLGLIALGWLLLAALRAVRVGWPVRLARPLLVAAFAALATLLVHGMVDDVFFGSRGLLLLFLPFALIARELPAGRFWPAFVGPSAAVALVLVLGLALLPGPRAALQANLGALSQAQAELSVYTWPTWPIQDALRRQLPNAPAPVNLAPAIARYRAALALDPANVTANRRLGQIELSQGDYAAATEHLQAAYAAAPDQFATRLLLGELLAVNGRTEEAAALWRGLDVSRGQLEGRVFWHEAVGEADAVRQIKSARQQAGL